MHWSAPTIMQSLHGFQWTPTVSVSTNTFKSVRNAFEIPVYAGSWAQLCVQTLHREFLPSQSEHFINAPKAHCVGDSFVLLYEGVTILSTLRKDQAMCQHSAACQKQCFLIYWLFIVLRLESCIEIIKTSRYTTVRRTKGCSSAVNLTEILMCVC